jgi:hypothetical protein
MSDVTLIHHADLLVKSIALNKCVPILITSLDKPVRKDCMCSWLLPSCSPMAPMVSLILEQIFTASSYMQAAVPICSFR